MISWGFAARLVLQARSRKSIRKPFFQSALEAPTLPTSECKFSCKPALRRI